MKGFQQRRREIFDHFIDQGVHHSNCFLVLALLTLPHQVNDLLTQYTLVAEESEQWSRTLKDLWVSCLAEDGLSDLPLDEPSLQL